MTLAYLGSMIDHLCMVYICLTYCILMGALSKEAITDLNGELVTLYISHNKNLETIERFWTLTIFP